MKNKILVTFVLALFAISFVASATTLSIGESTTVDGKTFTVEDIFSGKAQVNGEIISEGSTETINGLKIKVNSVAYNSNSPELSKVSITITNNGVSTSSSISYCCERLIDDGPWCQNAVVDQCDLEYSKAPTSCETTSYCKLGTCIDSQNGICTPNTPQVVCNNADGYWDTREPEEIEQCSLGCCLIGEQAAFVTQTRCKTLSSLYGLSIDFRTDISSEVSCIASVKSNVMGACVFEKDYEKTCLMLTQTECADMQVNDDNEVSFHEGYLCSAESLGTNCGKSQKTTCVEGKDEVYFIDTCGNIANIYDATKINDENYWSRIIDKQDSCNVDSTNGNSDSANCGNCDYYLGSTCKTYKVTQDNSRPTYGDNICRDLSCKYEGETYRHGETWCADSKGIKNNLPGSRYFRMVCYNGEVSIEPCADYRQEICVESSINDFKAAACIVNKWQDCYSQDDEQDCENSDKRDCEWYKDTCVPKYSPGFGFWQIDTDAESLCSQANVECIVTYEEDLSGDRECIENCECIQPNWEDKMNNICSSLGDCGSKINYLGYQGYNGNKSSVIYVGVDVEEE